MTFVSRPIQFLQCTMMRDSISSQTPTVVDPTESVPSHVKASQTEKAITNQDTSQREYQSSLDLSPEIQALLAENHAVVWKQDEKGNYLIKSAKGDPKNPRSWPNWRRYGVVGLASLLNNLVSDSQGTLVVRLRLTVSRSVYVSRGIVRELLRWKSSLGSARK